MILHNKKAPDLDRISEQSYINSNGCYIFCGARDSNGYGRINIKKGSSSLVHRRAWELKNGKINDRKLFVCHKCDVPMCWNVDHLFIGTNQDNVNDMVAKSRQQRLCGSKKWIAKLSEADIHIIRKRLTLRHLNTEIAKDYNVDARTISNVKRNITWRHVK